VTSAFNLGPILSAAFGTPSKNGPVLDDYSLRILVLAPNAIEWCVGATWCNSRDLYEFWRSYQTIRDYFELRCPICNAGGSDEGQPGDCWGRTKMYLEGEVLLRWNQANLEDTCPKCNTTRSEFIEDGFFHGYNQLHLVVGMRAGKSITAALIGTYVEHVFLSIGHTYPGGIHGFLGITPAELFEITFLASNQVQSESTIWGKYTGYRSQAPWFNAYTTWIGEQEAKQGKSKKRGWRYEEGVKKITNEHPNIRLTINALNSNSSGQAGRTRIHGFVDELDRMIQTGGRMGADEIYRTIEGSLHTIRSRVKLYGAFPWLGSMVSVTSPMSRGGKAMQLFKKASEIPDMYARKYPTWRFNPKEPRENFESDYKKDPIGADRDFGANPPGAEYPLIHDEQRWLALAVNKELKPKATFKTFSRRDPTGQNYVGVKLVHCDRMYDRRQPRFIVFDAGKNWDAFAGACAHGEYRHVEGEKEPRLITVYDWIVRIVPNPDTEIWFDSVRDLMVELKKHQFTTFVAFDHWNSVQIIQQIRDLGIPAEQEAIKDKDFVDWKVNCYEGRAELLAPNIIDLKRDAQGVWAVPVDWVTPQPNMAPESVAICEALELQCDPDTHEVSNPNKGDERGWHSDDVIRTVVHVHKLVQRAGFTDKYDDRSTRAARRRAEHGSVKWGGQRGAIVKAPVGGGIRNWNGGRGW
jgi:hypothetical protein